jgi:3-hydroxy-D-aspartate aldolase
VTTRPPADVRMPVAEIDTLALVVDLDAYEHNLDRMAAWLTGTPVRLRGHAKIHKCPVVALHQIARGAEVAVCVADPGNVRDLGEAARTFSVRLPVFVEIDVEMSRCGVAPGEPALALAATGGAERT